MAARTGYRLTALVFGLLILTSCGNQYNRGYDDAWDGKKNLIFYSFNPTYRQGHKEGEKELAEFRPLSNSIRQARQELAKTTEEFGKYVEEMGQKMDRK